MDMENQEEVIYTLLSPYISRANITVGNCMSSITVLYSITWHEYCHSVFKYYFPRKRKNKNATFWYFFTLIHIISIK